MEEKIAPKIENVVSTASLGCTLDLKKISLETNNAEYDSNKKRGLIMRISEPKSTAIIHPSGKMIITGTKSQSDSLKAANIFKDKIEKIGYKPNLKDFEIRNIVCCCNLNYKLNLSDLIKKLNKNKKGKCHYDPEHFPALTYKMNLQKISFSIFSSGKIILRGSTEDAIIKAFNNILPLFKQLKKKE